MNERLQLCKTLVHELGDRTTATPEQMERTLQAWEIRDYHGMVLMTNGCEIHVAKPVGAALTRRRILAALQPLIDRYGKATTAVMNDHEPGHRFVKRLGFRPVHVGLALTRYEMTRPAYA